MYIIIELYYIVSRLYILYIYTIVYSLYYYYFYRCQFQALFNYNVYVYIELFLSYFHAPHYCMLLNEFISDYEL